MLGIPLPENIDKKSRLGRWVRQKLALSGFVSIPLVFGTNYLISGVITPEMEAIERGPVQAIVEVPDPQMRETIGDFCTAHGKSWRDFIRTEFRHQGARVTTALPCIIGKGRL